MNSVLPFISPSHPVEVSKGAMEFSAALSNLLYNCEQVTWAKRLMHFSFLIIPPKNQHWNLS